MLFMEGNVVDWEGSAVDWLDEQTGRRNSSVLRLTAAVGKLLPVPAVP